MAFKIKLEFELTEEERDALLLVAFPSGVRPASNAGLKLFIRDACAHALARLILSGLTEAKRRSLTERAV
jgi:hypothetical protein